MTKLWEGSGGKVAATVYYDRGTQDFSPALTKLLEKNPDAIFPMVAPAQHLIVKQARELGYKGLLMGWGGDPWITIKVAGREASDGNLMYFAPGDPYGTTAPGQVW
jgi:ABC-type branched-subunit amino acid transport system substrate-binding protein